MFILELAKYSHIEISGNTNFKGVVSQRQYKINSKKCIVYADLPKIFASDFISYYFKFVTNCAVEDLYYNNDFRNISKLSLKEAYNKTDLSTEDNKYNINQINNHVSEHINIDNVKILTKKIHRNYMDCNL